MLKTTRMWSSIKSSFCEHKVSGDALAVSASITSETGILNPAIDTQLKLLQDNIMNKLKLNDTIISENSMVANNTINQWHFHNSINCEKNSQIIEVPTLLIHGYAASSMSFHLTFNKLSNGIRDLYAIDLPGNGLSETPLTNFAKSNINKMTFNKDHSRFSMVQEVDILKEKQLLNDYENYYLDRIDQWRKENGIKKFNIIGHSFGGYISFKYAITHPDQIENIGLISPLGMERNIYSLNNNFIKTKEYEITQEDPTSIYYSRNFKVPNFLFNNQLNTLRYMGPIGGSLAKRYINRAYVNVPGTEYHDYLYHIFYKSDKFPKTTILNFTNMFTRNLLAKDPILDNLSKLKAHKVLLMYGDHDWMNGEAGYNMATELAQKYKYKPHQDVDFIQVPHAGHNLFLDNPNFFSDQILSFLK
ncbi:similar to Saccharomyces cerevisiae YDR125C ECM18 Protein of unknown function, similar to Rlp24p [Maudiozyma saulgeensis]|uniref:AB hydrolase-1 domain-containing protein n=1 Tax=Maudiozyma saulgeensis TaxID=1789683 RepID=A0A1X7R7N0_9SACH|nr:similar to Saccharomyces cerevisiae YDR125C ECM18 Protein of unknown function, similar to Rlp24p [Kazachstania saulgeensis]